MKLQFKKYWLALNCIHTNSDHELKNANALFEMLREHTKDYQTDECQTKRPTSSEETGHKTLLEKLIKTNLKWYKIAKKKNTTEQDINNNISQLKKNKTQIQRSQKIRFFNCAPLIDKVCELVRNKKICLPAQANDNLVYDIILSNKTIFNGSNDVNLSKYLDAINSKKIRSKIQKIEKILKTQFKIKQLTEKCLILKLQQQIAPIFCKNNIEEILKVARTLFVETRIQQKEMINLLGNKTLKEEVEMKDCNLEDHLKHMEKLMDEVFSSYRFCCPLFLKERLKEPELDRDYKAILTAHAKALVQCQLDTHTKANKETSEKLQTALFFSVIVIGVEKLGAFIRGPYYDILKKIDETTHANIIKKAKEDEHYKNATPLSTIIKRLPQIEKINLDISVKEMVDKLEKSYNSIRFGK